MPVEGSHFFNEVGGNGIKLKTEKILDLRGEDEDGDAVGETDRDRTGDIPDDRSHPRSAHENENKAGHHGADRQIGQAVLLDDPVDDDDKGAGGPADLHPRTSQSRDDETGNDGGENARAGRDARGDAKSHGQGKRHDSHRDARHHVGGELRPRIVFQA